MSKHDDFLDDYIGYRIYEDSIKNAGKMNPSSKPTSPSPIRITKKSSDLGCGGWIAVICIAITAISIFGSCGNSNKSYSSSHSSYNSSRSSYSSTYRSGSSSSSSKSNTSKPAIGYNSGYSKSKSSSSDPYDAKSYTHPEDLYYDYPDDFCDYEDAEDYYNEHNDE